MKNNQISISWVDPKQLKPAGYNPRQVNSAQLDAICKSIVEFGIVDPIIARKDGVVIGGHQRLKAVEHLMSGKYQVDTIDSTGKKKKVPYTWEGDKVPVIYVDGLDEKKTKMLNLALNKVQGEWDHTMLGSLLRELNTDTLLEELTVTGFSPSEIIDYVDLVSDTPVSIGDDSLGNGTIPAATNKAPKLTIDFSSNELRDIVKTKIAGSAVRDELSGDTLAKLLGVTP